jgi:hypothetical protein
MHAEYRRNKAAREGRVLRQRRPAPPGHKWCPDCQEFKPVDAFGNGGLGQLGDDPARLRAALAYLLDAADRQAGVDTDAPDTDVAPVIDIHPPAYAEGDRVRWHAPAPVVVEYTYRAHPA